jgi:hypothetical protein
MEPNKKPSLGLLILGHAKKLKPSSMMDSLAKKKDPESEEEASEETKESDDNRLGLEQAMESFIEAVHSKDTEAAVDAFLELKDLC